MTLEKADTICPNADLEEDIEFEEQRFRCLCGIGRAISLKAASAAEKLASTTLD
jgi:hypothetical protein